MQALTFITLSKNKEVSVELKNALTSNGLTRLVGECSDADQLLADVIRMRPSAAVITLESDNTEKEFALIRKLVAVSPSTSVVAAARNASPALILGSMRSGAREFLQLPIIVEEFKTVLQRMSEFSSASEEATKHGRIIGVFAGKGGAGASFLATNLASATRGSTLLLDLNLQAGDAASFLGIDPKYTLTDVVRNVGRLDDSLLKSLVTSYSDRLSLLAAPLEAHEAEDIRPQDVTEILHLLSQRYEYIVVDLQHTFDPVTVAALDVADDVLLVLTLDIPGIRSTKRALKVFDRLDYPRRKVHIVVNRWSKNIDIELQKVQAHLGEQFIGYIPNDYRKVMESINLGRPHVEADPASKISVEIKRIAELVSQAGSQQVSPQPRQKLFRTVFGRSSTRESTDLLTLGDA
jgi:pilus assembly protein CpaE